MKKESKHFLFFTAGLVLLIAGYFVFRILFPRLDTSPGGIARNPELLGLMEYLEEQGFEPNPGFTTKFPPGTVIQVTSRDSSGNPVTDVTPRVFLTRSRCFPNTEPTLADAVLPKASGTQSRGIGVDASTLSKYLPKLTLDASITDSYALVIDNPGVLLIPRGEMLGTMTMNCRRALTNALNDGDKIEWFRIIDEVMVANGFSLKVNWKTQANAVVDLDAQEKQLQQFKNSIAQVIGEESTEPLFKVKDSNDRFVELATDKTLIFAFKARPLSVIKNNE